MLADGDAVFTDVTNGQEGTADLPAGAIAAAVALAGTTASTTSGSSGARHRDR